MLPGRNPEWQQLGSHTPEHYYDIMYFKDQEPFKFPEGKENLKKAFKDRFPNLTAKIDTYYSHVDRATRAFT